MPGQWSGEAWELGAAEKTQKSSAFFTLGWSHYVFLISVENPDERAFYEIEASAGVRCYVLIDLKLGKLSHQDLGQMQMYVNYFDRHVKTAEERPTVGIILCKKKHEALVEITLPEDSSIYASEYQLYLPSKEQLRQKLLDWAEEKPA